MTDYVIFNSEDEFDTAHEPAKIEAGLPRVGNVNKVPAPQNQQTVELTALVAHPSDGTFAVEIDEGWPENQKDDLVLKTKEEVSVYYPEKI